MGLFQEKVSTAILQRIRARRTTTSGSADRGRNAVVSPARLREATFSDFEQVAKLKERSGLAADSMQNWERLWRRNPALSNVERPIGWVLEAEGRIVGSLGNISLIYRYGDQTLTAVTGSGMVAEPAYRAASISLVAAFYRQKNVDLFLTTTAVEAVGKIARAFRSLPLPQPEYDSMLFWVLRPQPFAQVVMRKLNLRPGLMKLGSVLTSLAVRADGFFRRRRPSGASGLAIENISVQDIGDDFAHLWDRKVKERPRLLADRSPAALRWHFNVPGERGSLHVLCCHKRGELVGYAVVRHEPPSRASGLRRSIIADMLAEQDDPEVLRAVTVAAYEHAKDAGSDVFEFLGFPPNIRQTCSAWHPYVRKYPSCPFYYKAADANLHHSLSDGKLWYASPFDGDTTLWNFGNAS